MQITLSFETPISRADISILQALTGTGQAPAVEVVKPAESATEKVKEAVEKSVAKKAAAPKAEPKAAEPEKTPREIAIEKATALVGAGKHLQVKAALAEVSVARVSQLGDDDVEAFMAALEASDS
jgi:hypothetical protein